MNILVFGCNGMAGHLISLYLKEQGHQVTGFARSESKVVNSIVGDVLDKDLVRSIIDVDKYDTVINCVGVLNQFAEKNKSYAVYVNSFFPHFLADLTHETHTQVIQISTDCVFSGKRGQYTEGDFRDGSSFYDRTKALGELVDDKNLTLRQSIVGPDINIDGIGLMNWFLQQQGKVYGYSNAIWTGVTTLELSKAIDEAIKTRVTGLCNLVPENSISKCNLLELFNKYLRPKKIDIIPDEKIIIDKSLKRTNWDLKYLVPDYTEMMVELAEWMRNHKELYPHYY